MKVIVHVDGGARGNPGPAAAAAVVSAPDGRVLDEAAVSLGHATNNVAEYRGLLLGLERAAALGATEVEVINDSELVARQVDGSYKVKSADLKGLHAAAREAFAAFAAWSIRSVPRAQNAAADALVNRALDGDEVAPAAPLPETVAAGGTDYASYLFIDDLLELQKPITPGAHDELLFIVVHQAYELWFKLILHELGAVRDDLLAGRPHVAAPRLRRVVAIERLLLDQLDVLETMGPEGFLEFRDPLAPASGFQSRQFREIEWLSGERGTWPGGGDPPSGPSLYEAFRGGLGLPEDHDERLSALADLYRDHAGDPLRAAWHDVAELLVDHDERTALWRHHHTLMAAREIGTRMGTGGSRGVEYLRGTITRRYFPELWEVRLAL
ncbi:MAG TPA: tryptophan 2,3-dioxygenase family protein [Solirubrobacteraceae bacterium]|nr:tryptophan 2,3-dioxygenase family protein [Solirubrobacteraceae bacterium]